jgi:uncharacterized protein YbjT (DUF2867 family)
MTQLCLVTGATGYIGGRLIPRLLEEGVRVRVLVRHPERISQHPWHDQVEIVAGTADDPDVSDRALRDVDVAYYLIHAIGTPGDFEETERHTAEVFAHAAKANNVGKIVYLGGIQNDPKLSPHLRSRAEVNAFIRDVVEDVQRLKTTLDTADTLLPGGQLWIGTPPAP